MIESATVDQPGAGGLGTTARIRLSRLVASTDFAPLSWLYGGVYSCGVAYLRYRLRRIEAVLGLYLTGSSALSDVCHGISDIDYFIAIDSRFKNDAVARTAIALALTDSIDLFPFLGPYSERVHATVSIDADGQPDNRRENFAYRSASCSFKPVFERPGFSLRKTSNCDHLSVLSELNVLVNSVAGTMGRGADTPYFWKARLRSLSVLLFNDPVLMKFQGALNLDEAEHEVIHDLWTTSNHQLFSGKHQSKRPVMYRLFWKLINQVFLKYDFASLPEQEIEFRSIGTRAPISLLENEPVVASQGSLASRRFLSLDLTGASYDHVASALRNEPGCLLRFERFLVRINNGVSKTANIIGSPFAFEPASETRLTIKSVVMDRLVAQAKETLDDLRSNLANSTEQSIDEKVDRVPYALLVEDDLTMLTSLIDGYRLSKVTTSALSVYGSAQDVFDELALQYASHKDGIELVRQYYLYLTNSSADSQIALRLPPNFFGYLTRLFRHFISGEALPAPEEIHRKLSLSLCIVTKDRPTMLAGLLASVTKQSRAPDEVLIVDNSEGETTAACVERFMGELPVKYVRDRSSSLPGLRNRAIDQSRGDIISFTDDDCVLDYQYLAHVERTFLRSEKIGAVGGVMKHLSSGKQNLSELFHTVYLG